MKNLVIVGFLVLVVISMGYAQTPFDPPSITSQNAMLLAQYDSTRMISFTDTSIFAGKVQTFMLGHQWSNAVSGVNKRLYLNTYNSNEDNLTPKKDTAHPNRISYSFPFERYPRTTGKPIYVNYYNSALTVHAMSLQFDPEAPSTNIEDLFIPTSRDTLGAIFGFREQRGGKRGSIPIENRYVYSTDSVPSGDTGLVILSRPIGGELMHRLYDFQDKIQVPARNGRRWYLAINLRRSDTTWDNITGTNDTILTIKLPYRYAFNDDSIVTTSIHFDSVTARNLMLGLDTANYVRGGWMNTKLVHSGSADTIFAIRRNMLPKFGTNCDITLSAFFRTKDSVDDDNIVNKPFREGNAVPLQKEIDTLGMDIRYYPKCNIAIDWVRLETPEARSLFRGEQDSVIALNLSHCINVIRRCRDSVDTNGVYVGVSGMRIFRFYGSDEPSYLHMRSMRYASFLAEKYFTTEGGSGDRFTTIVPLQSYWGSVPRYSANLDKVPYAKYVMTDAAFNTPKKHHLGIKGGWEYQWKTIPNDTVRANNFRVNACDSNRDGSGYEKYSFTGYGWLYIKACPGLGGNWVASPLGIRDTAINGTDTIIMTKQKKNDILLGDAGLLGGWEASMNGFITNPGMLFSSKPWYSNLWIASEWFQEHVLSDTIHRFLQVANSRTNTGEELRLSQWCALTLGAKGLMYDNFDYYTEYQGGDHTWVRLGATGGYQGIDTAVLLNDSSGNFLLHSDKSGSDFLQEGEPTLLDKYINFDSTALALGVNKNRIYTGRKSQRLEVLKLHDRIHIIEDTLMRLQLMGWYGKGHNITKSLRNNDTTYFTKFLHLDSGYVKTKSLVRNLVEGWDSTFCDITIHKDTSVSMDSVFYVGVLNRRTNPLVRLSDTSDLRFYTTAEFDSLTTSVDTVWRNRRYKQGGSRELSLPFNYKDTLKRYALLHITELGGGIDTIIGQDRVASIKLLPGEGKMLKVQILRPNEKDGILAHSNQTKLTSHAKMSHASGAWLETDTVVHYMVYHKPIPTDTAKLGVFFRKSKPATKYMNTAAIQWDSTEYWLSQWVFHANVPTFCDTCAFPSIVTRFDSVSGEYRSYVVYGCKTDSAVQHYYQQYIVESVVRVKNDTVFTFTKNGFREYGLVLDSVNNRDLAEWGTPMVNASDTANFYCWADPDPHRCIVAGWKKPDSIPHNLVSETLISWTDYDSSGSCNSITAQHPSMNPYSRYIRGEHENDCALVWQEKNSCNSNLANIFYTRLSIDDGVIQFGLSPRHLVNYDYPVTFNANNTVLCVSGYNEPDTIGLGHFFPVVYRELFHADTNSSLCNFGAHYPGHIPMDMRYDGIYWQSEYGIVNKYGLLNSRWVYLRDTVEAGSFKPNELLVGGIGEFWGSGYIDHPVVSQGEAMYNPTYGNLSGCFNFSSRPIILEFRNRPQTEISIIPYLIQTHDSIAQIIQMVDQYQFSYIPPELLSIVDNGYLSDVHLAQRGTVKLNDWQRNHRIYNKTIPSPPALPTIRSSGQYFFRTAEAQPIALHFQSFGENPSSFGISSVIIGEHEYGLKRNQMQLPFDVWELPDTLSSDWFEVDNIETMDVITTGDSPDRIRIWLERQSDGATWDVTLSAGERMKIARETVELENGENENYRVRLCSYDHAPYHHETAITDEEEASGYGKKSSKEYSRINLGNNDPTQTVFIYPNPAREEVNLTIKGTERSEVIIVSAIGGEQTRFVTEGGKTSVLNTSNFSSGVYVARVRRKGMVDAVVPFVVVR